MAMIIPVAYLGNELPTGSADTNSEETNAIKQATDFIHAYATHYDLFPDYSGSAPVAPDYIVRTCIEVAKAYYWMNRGQVYRAGTEQQAWDTVLDRYRKELRTVDILPTISSVTIELDSNHVQLIARNQNILRHHPQCRVVGLTTGIWNQGHHWDIRRGEDPDSEQLDGWYLDADYGYSVEGTLYYARSWRNDGVDYQRWYWQVMATDNAAGYPW